MELDLLTFGVFKTLAEVALASGVILGLTGLAAKVVPDGWRDRSLPVLACVAGVGAALAVQHSHGDAVTVIGAMVGIVLGGTVTGLYGAAKDYKKTPQTVVSA